MLDSLRTGKAYASPLMKRERTEVTTPARREADLTRGSFEQLIG